MASFRTLSNSYEAEILHGLYNYVPLFIIRLNREGLILETQGTSLYLESTLLDTNGQNLYNLFPNMKDDLVPIFEFNQHTKFKSSLNTNPQKIYFENYAFPISPSEEDDKQAIIVFLDLTEDVRSREDLNEKNNELKAIFDAIPDIYFRLNAEGFVLDYKSAILSDMYIPREDFLNRKIETFLPTNLNVKIKDCIHETIIKKQLVTMEYQLEFNKTIRYFEARFFPLFNDQIILY
jgi:PAS domain-containing protein